MALEPATFPIPRGSGYTRRLCLSSKPRLMLQAIRDKSSGWIATIILGLLIVPFAFFGMEQYLFQSSQTYAAKIEAPPTWWRSAPDWWIVRRLVWHTEEIDVNEFRDAFERERQTRRQREGEAFDPRRFETLETKREVLDRLIDSRLSKLVADRAGLAIGDARLRDYIRQDPSFQVDGQFSAERYQQLLATAQPPMTPTEYQTRLRDDLQRMLLAERLRASAFLTPSERKRLFSTLLEKRDVSFAVLPAPVPGTDAVTPAEIAEWYRTHQEDFRAPEQVTLEYILVDGDALAVPPPTEEDVLTRYAQEKARFVDPEQRTTSHILVRTDADADEAALEAAKKKAEEILAKAQAPGADFAALAREFSDDTGSKINGGDLGPVRKGAMVKPFEDAVFAMQAGEIRGPVKSEFGFHIIQVREILPSREIPFDQIRPEVERLVAETARERVYNDVLGKVNDAALASPSSLAAAAEAGKFKIERIGPFAQGQGEGIAAEAAVQRFAFSDEAKRDGLVSDPIELGPNRSVLVRVVAHETERVRPLQEVGVQVANAIRLDRAKKATEAEADAILARARAGEDLQAIAAEKSLIATAIPGLSRGFAVPDQKAAEAYFKVPAPPAGGASYGKATLDDGRVVVFAVTGVGAGNPDEVPQDQRDQQADAVASFIAEQAFNDLIARQRGKMRIDVADQRL